MIFRNEFHTGSQVGEVDKTLLREISLAKNIQTTLLNGEKPKLASGEVSGVSIPARLIGGDYFDFYPLVNGKIRIIIGDVMGKGIPAAMLMILTRGAFRSASEATKGPGETLTAMNNAMYKDLRKLGSFVTVFCADWDPGSGSFVYANAGHCLPIFIRGNLETLDPSDPRGVMLGGLPDQIYKEQELQLKADDLVFLYTDGIVEAHNHDGDMFKMDRLVQLLTKHADRKAAEIESIVVETINQFAEGLTQKDDITMVILKIGQGNSEITSLNVPAMFP